MKALNKQALREAANAANIASWGKWESYKPHKGARGYEVKVGAKAVAQHCLKVDSEFIAAANPPTVLALLDELEAAEKRNAELQRENAYICNRHKELDLLIGKNILVMQAAIIEWQATGDAKNGCHGFITRCLGLVNCLTNLRKMLRPTLTANMHRLTKSLWRFTSGFGNKVKPNVPPLALA